MSLKDTLSDIADQMGTEAASQKKDAIAWFNECRDGELEARKALWEHRERVWYATNNGNHGSYHYSDIALGGTEYNIHADDFNFNSDMMDARHGNQWRDWRAERRSLVYEFNEWKTTVERAREAVDMEDLPAGCYVRLDVKEGQNAVSRFGFIQSVTLNGYMIVPSEADKRFWSSTTMRVTRYACDRPLSRGGRNLLLLYGPGLKYDQMRATMLGAREAHAEMERANHEVMRSIRSKPKLDADRIYQEALISFAETNPNSFKIHLTSVKAKYNGGGLDPDTNVWFLDINKSRGYADAKATLQATSEWLRGART